MPIGCKSFWDQLVETRCVGPDQPQIPDGVNIKQDGMLMHMLGWHVGNGISRVDPWLKVIDKIKFALALWRNVKLTLDGKILVIQYELDSRCQFITAA